jgi:hypothetical protein
MRQAFSIDEYEIARQILAKDPQLKELLELAFSSKDKYYSKLFRYYIIKMAFGAGISMFIGYLISFLSDSGLLDLNFKGEEVEKFVSTIYYLTEYPKALKKVKDKKFVNYIDTFCRMSEWFVDKFSKFPNVQKAFKGFSPEAIEVILLEYFDLLESLISKN